MGGSASTRRIAPRGRISRPAFSSQYGLPVICPCNYRPVITGVITCNYSPPFPVTSNR